MTTTDPQNPPDDSAEAPDCGRCAVADGSAPLLTRLQNHLCMMAPHQRDRYAGKLLIEATHELAKLMYIQSRCINIDDAVRIARGCLDYGGGYRSDTSKMEIFRHGIETVINSLEAAQKRGLQDTQVAALHAMGKPNIKITNEPPSVAESIR